jgi:hypothetical protein
MLRLELLKVKAEALVDQGIAVGFGTPRFVHRRAEV